MEIVNGFINKSAEDGVSITRGTSLAMHIPFFPENEITYFVARVNISVVNSCIYNIPFNQTSGSHSCYVVWRQKRPLKGKKKKSIFFNKRKNMRTGNPEEEQRVVPTGKGWGQPSGTWERRRGGSCCFCLHTKYVKRLAGPQQVTWSVIPSVEDGEKH